MWWRKKSHDPPIDVSSYGELMSQLREMKSNRPDGRLCYRGQLHDYPQMVPSMVRSVDSAGFDLKETVYRRQFWVSVAEEIAEEQFPHGDWDPAVTRDARSALTEGLLQHYGFPTHFVDVTSDPDIALCFGHYQYQERFPVLDGDVDRPTLSRVAWYDPSLESHGYLYVFDCESWKLGSGRPRHGQVIDLSVLVRPGRNRAQMQQAMLIHSDTHKPNNGDLRPLVRACFKFPLPLPGCDLALQKTLSWFPGPQVDPIYESLLGSRFVEQTYIADRPIRFWRRSTTGGVCIHLHLEVPPFKEVKMLRRALDIPEYHENPSNVDEIEYLRSFDKVVEPSFYFSWLRESVNLVQKAPWVKQQSGNLGSNIQHVLNEVMKCEAILLNVPFSELRRLDAEAARVRYKPGGTGLSHFFEFSPYGFLGLRADDHAPRGIWIGGTSERLLVTVMGAAQGKPWIADVAIFDWTNAGYQTSVQTERDMRPYLLIALNILRDMASGRAEVLPLLEEMGYRQLRYPITLSSGKKFGVFRLLHRLGFAFKTLCLKIGRQRR